MKHIENINNSKQNTRTKIEKTEKTNFVLSILNYLENDLLRITKKSVTFFYLSVFLYFMYEMQTKPLTDIIIAHWYHVTIMAFFIGGMAEDKKSFSSRIITGAALSAFTGALVYMVVIALSV